VKAVAMGGGVNRGWVLVRYKFITPSGRELGVQIIQENTELDFEKHLYST